MCVVQNGRALVYRGRGEGFPLNAGEVGGHVCDAAHGGLDDSLHHLLGLLLRLLGNGRATCRC